MWYKWSLTLTIPTTEFWRLTFAHTQLNLPWSLYNVFISTFMITYVFHMIIMIFNVNHLDNQIMKVNFRTHPTKSSMIFMQQIHIHLYDYKCLPCDTNGL